jgi:hypothetical protein
MTTRAFKAMKIAAFSAVLLVSLLMAVPASAATTSFEFTGHVFATYGPVDTGARVGDLVIERGAYDPQAPNIYSYPNVYEAVFATGLPYLQTVIYTASGPLSFSTGPGGSGDPMSVMVQGVTANPPLWAPGAAFFGIEGDNTTGVN